MYAIIESGGKQYRVEPGTTLQVEKLPGEKGEDVQLTPVSFIGTDTDSVIGHPYIDNAHVKATILRNGRTRSITIFKKKRRKGYRRTQGHRQDFTLLQIQDIVST
ncbi:MAG: 50S ribosomal protein L21 [Nitrospirales bacterium]|nr:50S ribosomal protein L21 [Nitrospirales bacterium]